MSELKSSNTARPWCELNHRQGEQWTLINEGTNQLGYDLHRFTLCTFKLKGELESYYRSGLLNAHCVIDLHNLDLGNIRKVNRS